MPGQCDPREPAAEIHRAAQHLRIGRHLPDAVSRSHLADGRVVGWYGDREAVIDAEIADQPVPRALAARFGQGITTREFWVRWTQTECAAKIANVPISLWISEHGVSPGQRDILTVLHEDVIVSVVFRRSDIQ